LSFSYRNGLPRARTRSRAIPPNLFILHEGVAEMIRAPPEFIYVRWVGLLSSLVPAIAFGILTIWGSGFFGVVYTIASFLPLLVISYYLDLILFKLPLPQRLKHPYLRVSLSWLIAFPISRIVVTELILIAIWKTTTLPVATVQQAITLILLMMLLGFAYGTFFYSAYITIFRIYVKRKIKKGEAPFSLEEA